jgi:hypothetical protein
MEIFFFSIASFRRKYILYEIFEEPRRYNNYPYDLDEIFFKELFFYKNAENIRGKKKKIFFFFFLNKMILPVFVEYLAKKSNDRAVRKSEALKTNALFECECCYNNEILREDMIECDLGHLFCM